MNIRKTVTIPALKLTDRFNRLHGNREQYEVTGYKEANGSIYALSLAGYTLYPDHEFFGELLGVYMNFNTAEKVETKQDGMTDEIKRQVLEGVFHGRYMSSDVDEEAKQLMASEFAANFDNRFNEIFGG